MAIEAPTVAAPPQAPTFTRASESANLDRRWAARHATGAAHDRDLRRKTAVVAPILIIVAGVIVYALLGH